MREADKSIEKTIKALESRFELVSKKKIKAWKAFIIIMFIAGFVAALFWSAYQGWSLKSMAQSVFGAGGFGGITISPPVTPPSSPPGPEQQKLKNLIFYPAGTKADQNEYKDLTDALLKEVEGSPYDSFTIGLTEVRGDENPSFSSLSSNLAAVKRSGKFVWPRIYFNRIVGCCQPPACVEQLKKNGLCKDKAARDECYAQASSDTGYKCAEGGFYCQNVCESEKSLSEYYSNIRENGKYIDLWDRAGALTSFYNLLETSLLLAKESGTPGIFIDHEIYNNYQMNNISQIAKVNGVSVNEVINRLEAAGRQIADITNKAYPDAVLLAASADFSLKTGNYGRSTNYILEGILKQAKEKKYKLKLVEGGEKSIWYLHSALDAPGVKSTMGSGGLKQRLEEQEKNMKSYLEKYPNNFVLGGTHGLYLNWQDTKGNWNDWAVNLNNKGQLKVKTANDFLPLLDYLFKKREYVWFFSGAPSSKGYNEFGYSKDPEYISQFRNILRPLFCGNGNCEKNRGESESSCPADCVSKPKDTTPPERFNGLPNGVLPAGTTQSEMSLATNESANCKYSANSGVSFSAMDKKFSTTGNKNHSVVLNNLADGKKYNYFVKCKDGADNENSDDYKISFSVANPAPGSNFLYKEIHSFAECQQKKGQVSQDGADYFCKLTGSSCPAGWEKFKNWSTTSAKTCRGGGFLGFSGNCTTGSHNWANIKTETCSYSGQTCSANTTAIGCY